jgi:hypothetical protein
MTITIWRMSSEEQLQAALHKLSAPIPSTKGMGPKERAQRLHSEIEHRIAIARAALDPQPGPDVPEAEGMESNRERRAEG